MVLSIENPKIIIPTDENGNAYTSADPEFNDRYLSFELKDPLRPAMRPVRQNIFWNQNQSFVEDWEALLPEERGGIWEPKDDEEWSIKMIPQTLRYIVNCEFYEYPLGRPCYMVYSQDLGSHEEGEIICSNGQVKEFKNILLVVWPSYKQNPVMDEDGMLKISEKTGLPVMTFAKDENGNLIQQGYVRGWSPDELGPRMASLYHPMDYLTQNIEEGIHHMPDDVARPRTSNENDDLDEENEEREAPRGNGRQIRH